MTTRETSSESYRRLEAEGRLAPLEIIIHEVLRAAGGIGLTKNEVYAQMQMAGHPYAVDTIGPRLMPMTRKGYIHSSGTRKCSVTGNRATVWMIGGSMTTTQIEKAFKKSSKEPSAKVLVEQLKADLAEAEKLLGLVGNSSILKVLRRHKLRVEYHNEASTHPWYLYCGPEFVNRYNTEREANAALAWESKP